MTSTNDLKQDITDTSNIILDILKKFEKRQGLTLEVNYEKKLFTTKLMGYYK